MMPKWLRVLARVVTLGWAYRGEAVKTVKDVKAVVKTVKKAVEE